VKSRIITGETYHCRLRPRRHAFRYRMFWLYLDLDELVAIDRSVRWFGHNRRSLVSITDSDYAGAERGTIREKVVGRLQREGVSVPIARVVLVTLPKVCGYVFNPVSFYLCYLPDGALAALVAEVHNTFGEAHHYVLRPDNRGSDRTGVTLFRAAKVFYVSPFLDVSGEYEVRLSEQEDDFSLTITLRQGGQPVFSAALCGRGTDLTGGRLTAALCRLPLSAVAVMARIHWQALQLYTLKRLPVFARALPTPGGTIAASRSNFWCWLRDGFVKRASRKQHARGGAPARTLSEENR